MDDILIFGATIGVFCLVLLLAVLSNRVGDRVGIPAPAFFLVGAALVSDFVPRLVPSSTTTTRRCS